MRACRSCGAPVVWFPTVGGGRMPLDPAARPDGNVAVVDGVAVVLGSERQALLAAEAPRYVSHFATCEQAGEHRRPRAVRERGRSEPRGAGEGPGRTTGVSGEVASGPGPALPLEGTP